MKKRGFYIDPLWIAFLMVGIAVGLMVASLAPAKAVEVVKEVPVEVPVEVVRTITKTVYIDPEEPNTPDSIGTFKVTAYCPCEKCCGKTEDDPWYGITATGTRATEGRTIAVDPDVIPYGTVLYFEGPDGLVSGFVAEDCGGAIKGNRIDLYFDSHEDALEWGVRELDVLRMEEGK